MMKRLLMGPAIVLAVALPPLAATTDAALAAEPGTVSLAFEVQERRGAVMVALFDSEGGYQKNLPVKATRVPVGSGAIEAVFPGLKPGRYAAKVFHDVNDDGALNTNPFGIPTEPFAFSNNAPPRFGPAAWTDAAFEVGPQGASQTLVLR